MMRSLWPAQRYAEPFIPHRSARGNRVGLFSSFVMAVSIPLLGARLAMITAATGPIALVIAPVAREYWMDYFIATVIVGGLFPILRALLGVAELMRFIPPQCDGRIRQFVDDIDFRRAVAHPDRSAMVGVSAGGSGDPHGRDAVPDKDDPGPAGRDRADHVLRCRDRSAQRWPPNKGTPTRQMRRRGMRVGPGAPGAYGWGCGMIWQTVPAEQSAGSRF